MGAVPDRSNIAASDLADLLIAARDSTILNKGEAIALSRYDTPLLNRMLKQQDSQTALREEFKVIVKGERGGALQAYSGLDLLTNFTSYETLLELTFGVGNIHLGEALPLQVLEAAGIQVDYSADMTSTGKNRTKLSADAKQAVVNLAKERMESYLANFNYGLNTGIWLSNSADPKMFPGLDALFPVTSNSTGTIGGKSRSNPLLRHQLITGATIDTLELNATRMVRAANDNNAKDGTRIDMTFAGDTVFDTLCDLYLGTSTRAGKIDRTLAGEKAKEMATKWGIGIPDDSWWLPTVGMVIREPSFSRLDAIEAPATPWAKRWYFLNSKMMDFMGPRHANLIPHPIPWNQRVQRMSLEGKYGWVVKKPNAHGVLVMA